ncbi:MAG: 50S ribosomal protein L21 [Proteobacteria bacterium]|nr:50S ribosomal protein L21 [Pseudomonadota bacterium]
MYAVVRTGGKQVRVSPGESVRVEKLAGEVGDSIELADVLLLSNDGDLKVGEPTLAGAKVTGTITAQGRGPKITVFKLKRRKHYRRKRGHRQAYTEIRVESIEG